MNKILIPIIAAVVGLGFGRLYYSQMFEGRWLDIGLDHWGLFGYWLVFALPFIVAAALFYSSIGKFDLNVFGRCAVSGAMAVVVAALALAGDVILCIVLNKSGCF
jgi:hypothetical protein